MAFKATTAAVATAFAITHPPPGLDISTDDRRARASVSVAATVRAAAAAAPTSMPATGEKCRPDLMGPGPLAASSSTDGSAAAADPYRYVDVSIRDVLAAADPVDVDGESDDDVRRCLVNTTSLLVRWEDLSREADEKSDDRSCNGVGGGGEEGCRMLPMPTLVRLAHHYERAIFSIGDDEATNGGGGGGGTRVGEGEGEERQRTASLTPAACSSLPAPMLGALRLSLGGETEDQTEGDDGDDMSGARTLAATMLCLNLLESAVCRLSGRKAGNAPLLKDMIEIVARGASPPGHTVDGGGKGKVGKEAGATPPVLAPTLRSLLLPAGINLRNLLWHGFLGSIPRRWLALTIGLTVSIEDLLGKGGGEEIAAPGSGGAGPSSSSSSSFCDSCDDGCDSDDLDSARSLSRHPALAPLLDHGRSILSSPPDLECLHLLLSSSSSSSPPRSFVPPTHRPLIRLALGFVSFDEGSYCEGKRSGAFPICFVALACVLLEHSLRLVWCESNLRPYDEVASPGSYFVTLDGHGQRDRHDIVLMPYVSSSPLTAAAATDWASGGGAAAGGDDDNYNDNDYEGGERNRLVERLGGPAVSYLSDLFSSPGGPNIRSMVTHGLWDRYLLRELRVLAEDGAAGDGNDLTTTAEEKEDSTVDAVLSDICAALISALHLAAQSYTDDVGGGGFFPFPPDAVREYRPVFSYAASMVRDVEDALCHLKDLASLEEHDFVSSSVVGGSIDARQRKVADAVSQLSVPMEHLVGTKRRIFALYDLDPSSAWTAEDVFIEHECNCDLVVCGAARTLLSDVSAAAEAYVHSVQEAVADIEGDDGTLNKRRRKRHARLCSAARITLHLYSFFVHVALLFIERKVARDTGLEELPLCSIPNLLLLKAVERSRMCASTFSLFTYSNLDRALKSAAEYSAGNVIRCIASSAIRLPH